MTTFSTGFDTGDVFSSNQNLNTGEAPENTRTDAQRKFRDFIRNFRIENSFIYRDQLRQNYALKKYYLDINLDHIKAFDETIADELRVKPNFHLPLLEQAATDAVQKIVPDEVVHPIQIMLSSGEEPLPLRNLMAKHISQLVQLRGIVTAASSSKPKATHLAIQCKTCEDLQHIPVRPGFGGATLPRQCKRERQTNDEPCGLDPYIVIGQKCKYMDSQKLKLQESPEDVPTGEMPRTVELAVDRYLVNKVVPGTRVVVLGMYTVYTAGGKGKKGGTHVAPYIRVVGLDLDTDGIGRVSSVFTPDEEEEFRRMASDPQIYEKLAKSVDPAIYGHDDIKAAIAVMLFGGSRKILPDGMRLRGDINVLLLGDPGCGKSQFLKFVEKVAPIAVYTSGKGSSAAGLTASVIRGGRDGKDAYLEAGAMVLADGGVVCIDEFDKMDDDDRVAIHEAMEQQTISIAKAGITTVLNSRTSVLAAANPLLGRYDDTRPAAEQIDFQSTILSRFDLIFLVRDEKNEERDKTIAKHVLQLHKRLETDTNEAGEFEMGTLKKFIAFCRAKSSPRLNAAAVRLLESSYVNIRQEMRSMQSAEGPAIPITVRQLEAIVRISEGLAKMSLSPEATPTHVEEALRLFKVSSLEASRSGNLVGEGYTSEETMAEVQAIEQYLARRLPMGSSLSYANLTKELSDRDFPDYAVQQALSIMIRREQLEYRSQRRMVYRRRA